MKFFKAFPLVFLITLEISVIGTGTYGAWIFWNEARMLQKTAEPFRSAITIPEGACDFPIDGRYQYLLVIMTSSDFAQTKAAIEQMIPRRGGEIVNLGESAVPKYRSGTQIFSKSLVVDFFVPIDNAQQVYSDIHSLPPASLEFDQEFMDNLSMDSLRNGCVSSLSYLRSFWMYERFYLQQLRQANGASDDLQAKITQQRSWAASQQEFFQDMRERQTNKMRVSLTLNEF